MAKRQPKRLGPFLEEKMARKSSRVKKSRSNRDEARLRSWDPVKRVERVVLLLSKL